MSEWNLRILESPAEMGEVEELQRLVWPGNETEIVPAHLLLAAVRGGGLVIGAFDKAALPRLIGFVFGFPGFYLTPDGPRLKHCSHMLGVRPDCRDHGLGYALKRAQWQMVRHQGLDRVTWTYDPLLSRNAHLNIAKLGVVCNTYHREYYGEMRDGLNVGLASDRFEVDWWVNTHRVERRLSRRVRPSLDLAHCFEAGAHIVNPTTIDVAGWSRPPSLPSPLPPTPRGMTEREGNILLVEIPADFLALKAADPALALQWRMHSRALFEALFERGYLVTDFVYLSAEHPRSFYVLTHGASTL